MTERKNHVLLKFCRVVVGKTKTMQLEKTDKQKTMKRVVQQGTTYKLRKHNQNQQNKSNEQWGKKHKPATPGE